MRIIFRLKTGDFGVKCAFWLLEKYDLIHAVRDRPAKMVICFPKPLHGDLRAEHYEDETAQDARIDQLRSKMQVSENPDFSSDYLDPNKRSIANSIKLIFNDGTESEWVTVEYPIGHQRRRKEGLPVLLSKFKRNLTTRFSPKRVEAITTMMTDHDRFLTMHVVEFMTQLSA